ncbi:MAG: TolC family protein [Polyangiaceae bacterium]
MRLSSKGLLLVSLLGALFATRESTAQSASRADVHQLLAEPSRLRSWVEQRSPDAAQARADARALGEESRAARLLPNPALDLSVSNFPVGPTNPRGLGLDRTLIYGAGLSETFEIGKRGPRQEAADLRSAAGRFRTRAAVARLVRDARAALGRVVYAEERQRVLGEMLSDAKRSTVIAEGRVAHQALAEVDLDRLRLDVASLEAEVVRARGEAQSARADCAGALSADCDAKRASWSDVVLATPSALPAATANERAELRALEAEAAAFRKDAVLAGRRAIPDVTARLGYTRDTFTVSGDNENTLSLSASIPLPFFDHGQHDRTAALARAEARDENRKSLAVASRAELASLAARRRAVEATLSSLEKDTLPRAEAVLRAQEEGLARGQLDMTDLILARRQTISLRLQALDLGHDAFQLKNQMRFLLGLDEPPTR